jgi:hypothetical protein
MSHSCDADVVPFVAHGVAYGSDREPLPNDELWKVLEPEIWVDQYGTDIENIGAFLPVVRGWSVTGEVARIGKKKRLYVTWLVKGDFKVAQVNESQYSNVGEYDESICADNQESIAAFLVDFADCIEKMPEIESNDTVTQWG